MTRKKESEFEKLARLIQEECEDMRAEFREQFGSLEKKVELGFAMVNRRLDTIIQMQLDDHAHRIKKLEAVILAR